MASLQSDDSFLLALPMELIQRITVQLDDDRHAIFSIRFTCKPLEAAIFDRFADTFFRSRRYCIFYKRSLLNLQNLLTSSSRLTARMQRVTLTSSFFENSTYRDIKLALLQSETDLGSAQSAAMKAYAQSQVETLHKQSVPDAELIRSVLVPLQTKCPGIRLDLDLINNVQSSIPVHADVLQAVSSVGTAVTCLFVDSNGLGSVEIPGISRSTSTLRRLRFANPYVAETEDDETIDQHFQEGGYGLLRSVLGSTSVLLELELNLKHDMNLPRVLQITSELLVARSHPRLRKFRLQSLAITQGTLLTALTKWGKELRKVRFANVCLTDVEGEGWLEVLRTLSTMPKLREVRLEHIYFLRNNAYRNHVDFGHLTRGHIRCYNVEGRKRYEDVAFWHKTAVKKGLQELLRVGLRYYSH
jgi:hypothetical protein